MKIDELIEELEKVREEHGNLEVKAVDGQTQLLEPVEPVAISKKYKFVELG